MDAGRRSGAGYSVSPQIAERTKLASLVPLAYVADVGKAVEFYQLLGFAVKKTVEHEGHLQWAWLENGGADLMLAQSGRPMNPGAQDILFYMYAVDVTAYRADLESKGVKAGPIKYPFYSPRGEFRIEDPDGYTLMVSHAD
jgi:uncharacterized glyoxalase superfamily protein PhnB